MAKHIIWDSEIDLDKWREDLIADCEANGLDWDEDGLWYMAFETNNSYLEDELCNLNIPIPEGVIAIADIGRWNGRVMGYREMGNNITDCLYTEEYSSCVWYVDEYGRFCGDMGDHDGMTYVVYKAWKPGVTEEQKDRVMDAIYNQTATERMLRRYLRNIGGEIADVYGWKVSTGRKKN